MKKQKKPMGSRKVSQAQPPDPERSKGVRKADIVIDPIERLKKEHNSGLQRVDQLENSAISIRLNGFSVEAFEQIANTVRWINIDVHDHMEREEKYLLTLVERHDQKLAIKMKLEHRELCNLSGQLLKRVEDVEEGQICGTVIPELVNAALTVAGYIREHIMRENSELFPSVKEILTKEEYKQFASSLSLA